MVHKSACLCITGSDQHDTNQRVLSDTFQTSDFVYESQSGTKLPYPPSPLNSVYMELSPFFHIDIFYNYDCKLFSLYVCRSIQRHR
ncbi:hypothetical protein HanRHA438_Chr15g0711181 [Helianthus annuus]|nr:hypothetical protein HanRHA438_Chr15g0711181 [Helianthus annuus]